MFLKAEKITKLKNNKFLDIRFWSLLHAKIGRENMTGNQREIGGKSGKGPGKGAGGAGNQPGNRREIREVGGKRGRGGGQAGREIREISQAAGGKSGKSVGEPAGNPGNPRGAAG